MQSDAGVTGSNGRAGSNLCAARAVAALFCAALSLTGSLAAAPGAAAADAKKTAVVMPLAPVAVPIELTGEVVDSWCFASQVMGDGRGPKHQACALACVMGGVTPGIVDDKGMLYLCVKHKAYQGCKDLLTPFVGKRVTIKGHLATKGGVRVLKVTTVKLAK